MLEECRKGEVDDAEVDDAVAEVEGGEADVDDYEGQSEQGFVLWLWRLQRGCLELLRFALLLKILIHEDYTKLLGYQKFPKS